MRRLPSPPVHQTVVSLSLVALTPAPHVPVADPKDLGRLPPCNLFRHGLQHHVLYFHRPLHRGLRVRVHASHGLLPSPPEKRTYHLLSQPDISSATDRKYTASCQAQPFPCILAADWDALRSVFDGNCIRRFRRKLLRSPKSADVLHQSVNLVLTEASPERGHISSPFTDHASQFGIRLLFDLRRVSIRRM